MTTEPTTMDLLVNQIQDYKRQQAEATASRDNIVAQCEGGIKTCLWMIKVLQEAKAKDEEAARAAVLDIPADLQVNPHAHAGELEPPRTEIELDIPKTAEGRRLRKKK